MKFTIVSERKSVEDQRQAPNANLETRAILDGAPAARLSFTATVHVRRTTSKSVTDSPFVLH
jgi:hypothetical protein